MSINQLKPNFQNAKNERDWLKMLQHQLETKINQMKKIKKGSMKNITQKAKKQICWGDYSKIGKSNVASRTEIQRSINSKGTWNRSIGPKSKIMRKSNFLLQNEYSKSLQQDQLNTELKSNEFWTEPNWKRLTSIDWRCYC